jgi:hypothetical protein
MAAKPTNTADETNRERFKRLGEKRVNDVLTGLAKVEQLANANSYEYSDEQVGAIEQAIQTKVDDAISALQARKINPRSGFSL